MSATIIPFPKKRITTGSRRDNLARNMRNLQTLPAWVIVDQELDKKCIGLMFKGWSVKPSPTHAYMLVCAHDMFPGEIFTVEEAVEAQRWLDKQGDQNV